MKTILVLIASVLFCFTSVYGQVTDAEKLLRNQNVADTLQGWKTGGVFSVNMAQTSLTNWAAGGQNSIAMNGMLSVFANYKKGNSVWDNSLDLGYGLLKQNDEDFRKTDDKIDLVSKYGRKAFTNFYYAALMNFKTQFTDGYKYPDVSKKISDLLAPAYLTTALGLDYKPSSYFSAFIAPLTAKFTFVTDESLSLSGAFGVDPGENIKSEIGGYIRAIYSRNDFNAELLQNVSFTTKIDLFSNYIENPQNIDISWETLIAFKVNKFLSVNFNTLLMYDDNITILKDRNNDGTIEANEGCKSLIQFKEIFGVGFSYKF
ncbi:MAG: DUF3078 domain-containing protein [Bacteroidales bacterium]|jgi:hypothetical protein|nr:DUF3078 domain-containing protein [Bacteroidales bacterium]